MALEIINIGELPNDGTGDPVRVAFEKINNNFSQVQSGNTFSYVTGPEGSVQYKKANDLFAVAIKGNITLAVGYPSRAYTTTGNLSTANWVEQTLPTSSNINDIIVANGNFWGVGANGAVVTSNNGATWANAITAGNVNLNAVIYDSANSLFVSVGDSGRLITSGNGITWTTRTSGTSENLHGITFAPNVGYIAVGANGTLIYSSNAVAWANGNSTVSTTLRDIVFDGDNFTAVGDSGTVINSPDLTTWANRSGSANISVNLNSIAYATISNVLTLVAVGGNGQSFASTDGNAVTWTGLNDPLSSNLVSIVRGTNAFVAVGETSSAVNLADGTNTWSNVSLPTRMEGNADFIYDQPNANILLNANIIPQSNANVNLGSNNHRIANGYFTSIDINAATVANLSVTSLATISSINVAGLSNLGDIGNITILGGNNGYFLQTDGSGGLTWAPAGNGGNGGNGSPAGANTQVQFNDQGNFGGDAGFTYNKVSNVLSVNTVTSFNQTISNNLTVSNTLTTLTANVTGNLKSGNANLGNLVTANYISVVWDVNANVVYSNYVYGDGSNLTNLPPVSNANYANTSNVANSANTANTANIANVAYSVSGANVVGDVAGANTANIANIANVAYSVSGANVSGTVANATYALFAGTAYSVSGANVTGTVANANYANIAGTAYAVSGANVSGEVANANYASYSDVANSADTANIADTANVAYSVDGANVVGEVANSNYSNFANFAFNVNGVNVSGTVANANYSVFAGTAYAVNGANVSGEVANANFASFSNVANTANTANVATSATSANTAGTVTTAAQPNITSVGTLSNLTVTNNVFANNGNFAGNGSFGNLQVVSQIRVGSNIIANVGSNLIAYGNVDFFNATDVNLGEVSELHIAGGSNGYFLRTDGAGNLTWAAVSNGGGSNTVPGGANTELQFNDAGSFGGSSALVFDKTSNTLTINGYIVSTQLAAFGNVSAGNANLGNLVAANFFQGSGNRLSNIQGGNVTGVVANANYAVSANFANVATDANYANYSNIANVSNLTLFSNTANTVVLGAQPNITSVGNLVSLNVDGNFYANNANIEGNGSYSNLQVVNQIRVGSNIIANVGSNLIAYGNVDFFNATDVNLGEVSELHIAGGSNGYFLRTDGAGNLTWAAVSNGGGGNTSPAGSNAQVQFNSNGSFGASAAFVFDYAANILTINGGIVASSLGLSGNISATNANLGNLVAANFFQGSGNRLSNIQGANVSGEVANANYASYSNIANVSNSTTYANSADTANFAIDATNANVAITVSASAQPNIRSVGNLTNLIVTGGVFANTGNFLGNGSFGNLQIIDQIRIGNDLITNVGSNLIAYGNVDFFNATDVNLGEVDELHIAGGSNGYFLRTDGLGNLFWGEGNAAGQLPGGGNTTVQFNDNGNFNGASGFTYNKISNTLSLNGNINALSITTATATFTSNISALNASLGNLATANFFQGSGNRLSNIVAANVTGTVANANYAAYAGNAFSVNGANVIGTVANANFASFSNIAASANTVDGANVSGEVANANYASFANIVVASNQPNITTLGNLTALNVGGNGLISGNLVVGGNLTYTNVTSLEVEDPIIMLGGGPNGAPLTTNDGKDRGTLLHYYTTQPVDAFMGWDNSNGEFAFGSNVTNANDVITFNTLGNVRANVFIGSLVGNATSANVANVANSVSGSNVSGEVANANFASFSNVAYSVDGANVSGEVANANFASFSNVAYSVDGANVSGEVANANYATFAGTAYSVSGSNVSGEVANANYAVYAATAFNVAAANVSGIVSNANFAAFANVASSANTVDGANVIGTVANANYAAYSGNTDYSTYANYANFAGNATISNSALYADDAGNANIANIAFVANTVTDNAQPNITSVGTLSNLSVSNLISGGNLSIITSIGTSNLSATGNVTVSNILRVNSSGALNVFGNANLTGNINTSLSGNVNLGDISNIHISGGINGYFLQTDGAGNLAWAAAGGGGGNGSPGGINKQVQFNDGGTFGGNPNFTFDKAVNNVTIGGNLIANALTLGSGIYQFSMSNVYFASTISNAANQEIYSISTANLAGLDFTIISDDSNANIRNISKISAIVLGNTVNYNETSTLAINGYTGDFSIVYFAGNLTSGPAVQLLFSPQSSNLTTHKMMITTLKT